MFSFFKTFVDFTFKVKKITMVPVETVTNEALKPKDIEYFSYPEAADREEQIAQAEASAMLLTKNRTVP
jgi:hypothetical protein